MAPFELRLGQNESYVLQEPFKPLPALHEPISGPKYTKKSGVGGMGGATKLFGDVGTGRELRQDVQHSKFPRNSHGDSHGSPTKSHGTSHRDCHNKYHGKSHGNSIGNPIRNSMGINLGLPLRSPTGIAAGEFIWEVPWEFILQGYFDPTELASSCRWGLTND